MLKYTAYIALAFCAFLLMLLMGCGNAPENGDSLVNKHVVYSNDSLYLHQIDSLNALVLRKDTLISDVFTLLIDIQEEVSEIQNKKIIFLHSFNILSDDDLEFARNEFSQYITEIKTLLRSNKNKINTLQKLVKKNNLEIKQLSSAIIGFEQELNARNKEIADLEKKISNNELKISELEDIVASLYAEFTGMDHTIKQQEEQLNTVWYCVADRKVLLNSALISKKGRVLSIDASLAQRMDIRTDKEILVNAKKATILTTHPIDSYTLVENNGMVEKVVILNSSEFWSISRYCVVQIRN